MAISEAARMRIVQEVERLPEGVRRHIEEVRRWAVDLARAHRLDVAKAELAAVAHDICRTVKAHDLLALAREHGVPVTPLDEAFPVFLHGPVGAQVLKRKYSLADEEVLSAIACHTMGKAGMSPLDKALFLADKLDPSKVSRYPFIAEVARLAKEDLDGAMICFLDHQVQAFVEQGELVHPGMIVARNEALLTKRKQP
jgi:predicted HD superfamily hydrolase involved in NAD metabolism